MSDKFNSYLLKKSTSVSSRHEKSEHFGLLARMWRACVAGALLHIPLNRLLPTKCRWCSKMVLCLIWSWKLGEQVRKKSCFHCLARVFLVYPLVIQVLWSLICSLSSVNRLLYFEVRKHWLGWVSCCWAAVSSSPYVRVGVRVTALWSCLWDVEVTSCP